MQLNNLSSAWKQRKLLNAMSPLESKEILSIIENAENSSSTKLQRAIFTLVMFVALTIFCQGG
jgi:hypothetical protein